MRFAFPSRPCQDIEAVDPAYYKNLKWMLDNDITDVLDLTFTAESDFFGKTEVRRAAQGEPGAPLAAHAGGRRRAQCDEAWRCVC